MQIEQTKVTGLEECIHFSGLPMKVNTSWDLGNDDLRRADNLANTRIGTGHDNFLNGITVHFLLTATNKFWVEMQRYHFIDFVSSQSTMHKLKAFDLENAYIKYVDPRIVEIMKELQDKAQDGTDESFLNMIYSNPAGMELSAYMVTNYRQLKTIYLQRKFHRLPEWKEFCIWIESLPHSEFITR